jgi:hypothetical protein
MLNREKTKALKKCVIEKSFNDCNDCILFPDCWAILDIIETLEAAWDDSDRKEIEHEKARREVELQLENSINKTRILYQALTKALADNIINQNKVEETRKLVQEVANNGL